MYFLLKKPNWIVFDPCEYADEEVRCLQVRYRGSRSNTKLVKFEDGTWYLKNGSQMFPLRSIDLKTNVGMGSRKDNTICVDEIVSKKWFIKPKNAMDMVDGDS